MFLRKRKIELLYDPAIPFLGIYPDKTIIQNDPCSSMFLAALFINIIAKIRKQSKCPLTDEWIKKMWFIYIYITQPGKRMMIFAAIEIIIQSEVSQKDKDKYHVISLVCVT